jgi:hypothetical protein
MWRKHPLIAEPALRVVVTALFALAALYCAGRLTRRVSIPARGTYAAHLLMSVAMIVMAWPAGVGILPWPQVLLFSVGTLWFIALAISFARGWAQGTHHETHGRLVYWYHAVMMAAMVWMLVVMDGSLLGAGGAHGGSAGSAETHDHGSMTGMEMAAGHEGAAVIVIAWILGLLFCVAALAWLGSLVPEGAARRQRPSAEALRSQRAEVGYETLMAVGMAITSFAFL